VRYVKTQFPGTETNNNSEFQVPYFSEIAEKCHLHYTYLLYRALYAPSPFLSPCVFGLCPPFSITSFSETATVTAAEKVCIGHFRHAFGEGAVLCIRPTSEPFCIPVGSDSLKFIRENVVGIS